MAEDLGQWRARLLGLLVRAAMDQARPGIPSRTLRRDLLAELDPSGRTAFVVSPYYWALHVHDGTKAVWHAPTSGGKRLYVFYRNKRDDPRTDGGRRYPRRAAAMRPLTDDEYDKALRRNRERRKRGQPPFAYFVRAVRSPTPTPGAGFFDTSRVMRGYVQRGEAIIAEELETLVRRELGGFAETLSVPL